MDGDGTSSSTTERLRSEELDDVTIKESLSIVMDEDDPGVSWMDL